MSRRDYRPCNAKRLAQMLHMADRQKTIFDLAIHTLLDDGKIDTDARGQLTLTEMPDAVTGIYLARFGGGGVVRTDKPYAQGNLIIGPENTHGAIHGDTVKAKVLRRTARGRQGSTTLRGAVTAIIERTHQPIVGTLYKRGKQWFAVPDGRDRMEQILLQQPPTGMTQKNHKVAIELNTAPTEDRWATGRVVEDLGTAGDDLAERKSVIRRYRLPGAFAKACTRQARNAAKAFDDDLRHGRLSDRDDIRNKTIITIDPKDARDFDDAISITQHKDGTWQLGVHIADVSHFVTHGSALDQEAAKRANSTYLPGEVIPMLPETLSNGVCSLVPDEDRLAKSIYIDLDAKGQPIKTRPANSIMRSTARLTYEQAEKILAGDHSGVPAAVTSLIKKMETLARLIQKRREKQGMLHLDLPKGELIVENGKVVGVRPESTSFPHTMIEMFMVEANEAAARMLDARNVPFLRRIHPEPDGLSTAEGMRTVSLCGYKIPQTINRFGLRDLLAQAAGKPESFVINLAVLRSLSAAEYSPSPLGHYALASEQYCHFTSPIRRYADLTVHRLIDLHIRRKLDKKADIPDRDELVVLGRHCSDTERNAEKAESDLKTYHVLKLLADRIGEPIDGIITQISGAGLWVRCEDYLIEGLLRAEDMPRRHGTTAKSHRGGKTSAGGTASWRIGQTITVELLEVNLQSRMCYLAAHQKPKDRAQKAGSKGKTRKTRPSGRRRGT